MHKYITIKIILLIFIFAGCKTTNDKFDELFEHRLKLPDSLENYNPNIDNLNKFSASPVKIISTVNFGCSKCCGHLLELTEFIDSLNIPDDKLSLIIYGYAQINPKASITDYLLFDTTFNYPIFVDATKQFIKINNLPEFDENYHTFLIDKNNIVRLIGSPAENPKLAELYKQEISKLLENNQ